MKLQKKAISWLVIILTVAIIAFDVYLAVDGVESNTYSARIRAWSENHFYIAHVIAAGMGFLAWHWFRNTALPGGKKLYLNALALILSVIAGGILAEVIGFY